MNLWHLKTFLISNFLYKKKVQISIGILLEVHTDSLSLFDILSKATTSTEQRFMIDFFCVKNASDYGDIISVFFKRSEYNLADALTKGGRI